MAISIHPVPEQYARVQENMRDQHLDAIIAFSMENFYWLSNALVSTMKFIPDRLGAVLSILDEDPVLLTCSIEESLVLDTTWIKDVRTYVEFQQSPIAVLAEIMRKKGLGKGRVGIEMNYLVAKYYDEIKQELPGVEFVDVGPLFGKMRMIKTAREIEILAKAAFETEKAITTTYLEASPKDREIDIYNGIVMKLLNAGADSAFGTFGCGPKSAIAHPIADKTPLTMGAIGSADFVGSFHGYYGDIGRTAVVGSPSERQSRIYKTLYDTQRRLIDMVRPGVPVCDLCIKAIELLQAGGIDLSLSHTGHGIGLVVHEDPMMSPTNKQPLLENMVINIEPLYLADEGYHVEDTLLVTKDGCEILTTFRDHSQIIPITDK